MTFWNLVRFGHVLGVTVWLGGMVFLGLVAVPAVRASSHAAAGREVLTRAARRFGVVGGLAWLLILVTGFGLMSHRNIQMSELLDTDSGQKILAKLLLLIAVGVAVVLHGLWQGPRVRRFEEAGDEAAARRWRAIGGALDGFMLLATLVALWLATSLIG